MNEDFVVKARAEIESALAMLNRQPGTPELMYRIAASRIVAALMPNRSLDVGSEYYRIKAEDWLSMLLTEPHLDIKTLHKRLAALASVSANTKAELGGLPGRLMLIMEPVEA